MSDFKFNLGDQVKTLADAGTEGTYLTGTITSRSIAGPMYTIETEDQIVIRLEDEINHMTFEVGERVLVKHHNRMETGIVTVKIAHWHAVHIIGHRGQDETGLTASTLMKTEQAVSEYDEDALQEFVFVQIGDTVIAGPNNDFGVVRNITHGECGRRVHVLHDDAEGVRYEAIYEENDVCYYAAESNGDEEADFKFVLELTRNERELLGSLLGHLYPRNDESKTLTRLADRLDLSDDEMVDVYEKYPVHTVGERGLIIGEPDNPSPNENLLNRDINDRIRNLLSRDRDMD